MKDFTFIIQEKVKLYSQFIKSMADSNQNHHFNKKSGGFPLLCGDINQSFYEQSFFDELIENTTWRYLVNGVLKELFKAKLCEENDFKIEWSYMHPQLTSSFIEDIENRYPVEFTIIECGVKTAFRYTNCYFLEKYWDSFFEKRGLDQFIILDFSNGVQSSFLHPLLVPEKYRSKVKRIPFETFFASYFSTECYEYYVKETSRAISDSYKYVGLQTVSNLTLQSLPYFIESEQSVVEAYPYSKKEYEINKALLYKAKQWYGCGIISDDDKKTIQNNFKKRFLTMLGSEDHAQSFITSEYLYCTLKDNNHFDYTSIVSGYLKAIEQL